MFDTANCMTGWQDQSLKECLYDVTPANGLTHRFHAKQMWLRFTQLTDDDLTAFADAFNLPFRRPQVASGETGHLDEHAVDHTQQTSNQGTPALDDVKLEQSRSAFSEPRHPK